LRTRAFVAVDVPTPVVAGGIPAGSPAPPSHLTLRFFDELEPSRADPVVRAVDRTAAATTEFTATLEGIGAFPDALHPRVVWVGVVEGNVAMKRLAERLSLELEEAGIRREPRPFSAHVTVLRVRGPDDLATAREWLGRPGPNRFGSTVVRELLLKESRLRRSGPEHQVVHRSALSRGSPTS
jgi:2'-5' RNA ligase